MVRNNFMMHLCTFATLCFFKITFPRNYYYCNQDDTIPWVCVLKYVSNSNCCHRHLKLYISMFKSFHTYRKYIYQQSTMRWGWYVTWQRQQKQCSFHIWCPVPLEPAKCKRNTKHLNLQATQFHFHRTPSCLWVWSHRIQQERPEPSRATP